MARPPAWALAACKRGSVSRQERTQAGWLQPGRRRGTHTLRSGHDPVRHACVDGWPCMLLSAKSRARQGTTCMHTSARLSLT